MNAILMTEIAKEEQKELKKTALYAVWCDMKKQATREYMLNLKYGINKPIPVHHDFKEFDGFLLWAVCEMDYTPGKDDQKILARKDIHGVWGPDNCHFVDRKDVIRELEYLENEITKGASSVRYKSKSEKGKWLGLSNTRLYEIWKGMCRRCTDKNQKDFPDYGGRGIQVCDEWRKDFLCFEEWAWEHGYSVDLSIDRVDVNGNYCPENCRWASYLEQKLNTRKEAKTYSNIRLNVRKMREYLSRVPDDAVVTVIIRKDKMPEEVIDQDDYAAIPVDERIDLHRKRGA